MNDLNLLWPWVLGVIPLLGVVIYLYWQRLKGRTKAHMAYPGASLASAAMRAANPWRRPRFLPALIYGSALLFAVVALARPTAKLLTPDDLSGVMLAVETSHSMLAPDIPPTRLAATQDAANALLKTIPDNIKVGLATFSGYAALNVPLTLDHARVAQAVDTLSMGGSYAFSYGLIAALEELPEEPPEEGLPGAIVLFSHGHDNTANDPLALAEEASARGIKIHTVGVGTHGYNFDDDVLQLIADRTGGRYYPIYSAKDLRNAHRDLGRVITLRPKTTEVSAFAALIAAGLLSSSLLLAGLRRRVA